MLAISQFIIYNQVSMSIPNLFHKIKSKINIEKITIIYMFIIVGVGIGSFGLGRLSIDNNLNNTDNIPLKEVKSLYLSKNLINNDILPPVSLVGAEKRYVASKNGKMYYSVGCSGAKRINPENEVWFSTALDAEKSGFTLASACK